LLIARFSNLALSGADWRSSSG